MVLSFDAGEPLFENIHQFAHLQAIVWELIIPVKGARLKQLGEDGSLLLRLLEKADVLDFPGVSNVGTGGDDRLSQDIVAKNGSHLLFSHFLKRGKTSAMVAATARWGSIDGFSLMFRTMGPIARPGIISEGIRTWWNFTTGEDINTHSKDGPPINIVLTFFAEFLNDLIRNPQIQRLGIAFEKLRSLGAISSPNVSQYFTALFPKYEKLDLPAEGEQDVIKTIIERIMADPETATLFRDGGMIRRMIFGNGVSTVIEALIDQATGIVASRIMEKRRGKVESEFLQLIDEAAPGESSEDFRRKELLSRWSKNIRDMLGANESFDPKISEQISQSVRKLLTVLPEDLDSIPINIIESRRNTVEYVQTQLSKWRDREHSGSYPLEAGVPELGDTSRLLGYLCDSVSTNEVSEWLRENFGWVNDRSVARNSRRYLAVYLTDRLLGAGKKPHRTVDSNDGANSYALLRKLAEAQARRNSCQPDECPHYISILGPFFKRLDELATAPGGRRPPQSGDEELKVLLSEIKKMIL